MADNNMHDTTDDTEADTSGSDALRSDGGVTSSAEEDHKNTNYLDQEVNILDPSTTFMQDHLQIIWKGFAVWFLIVFGPVTLTAIAPDAMTTQMPAIGFPLHYFLVAIGAPSGAILLSIWYARERDKLDQKYGIQHATTDDSGTDVGAAATDGGTDE